MDTSKIYDDETWNDMYQELQDLYEMMDEQEEEQKKEQAKADAYDRAMKGVV